MTLECDVLRKGSARFQTRAARALWFLQKEARGASPLQRLASLTDEAPRQKDVRPVRSDGGFDCPIGNATRTVWEEEYGGCGRDAYQLGPGVQTTSAVEVRGSSLRLFGRQTTLCGEGHAYLRGSRVPRMTFAACGPFAPWTISNSTASPSFRVL